METQTTGILYPSIARVHERNFDVVGTLPKMTIYDYVYQNNIGYESNDAFDYLGTSITYGKFFRKVNDTARALQHYRVQKGDIVTLMMPTQPETFYVIYALSRMGAIANMADPRYSSEYLEHAINKVESKLVVASTATGNSLEKFKTKTSAEEVIMVSPGTSVGIKAVLKDKELRQMAKTMETPEFAKTRPDFKRFIKDGRRQDTEFPDYEENRTVILVGTGGTTGTPKLVELTNDNINGAVFQCINARFNFQRGHTWYDIMPPFIAFGVVDGLHLPLVKGMKIILEPQPTPENLLKAHKKQEINHQACGPNFYTETKDDPKMKELDLSGLDSPILGGKNINSKNEEEVNDALALQGCPSKVRVGWGLTECCGAASAPGNDEWAKPQSVGMTLPGGVVTTFKKNQNEDGTIELEELPYVPTELGQNIPEEMIGELAVAGPNVMRGYYNNPEETAKVLVNYNNEQFLLTGDLGYVDSDGVPYVVNREKELVIRHTGFKVPPKEIEDIILMEPTVDDCKVVGFENPETENDQLSKAYYTLKKDCSDTDIKEIEQNMSLLCELNLPNYKWPVAFECLEKMPLTPIAKIDVKALQEDANSKAEQTLERVHSIGPI